MAGNVYLLIDGPADERETLAAFSTREAAEAALHLGSARATVEEFALDAPLPLAPPGHFLWCVAFDEEYFAFRTHAFHNTAVDQVTVDRGFYRVEVWAPDKEQALRLGIARIEQFMLMARRTA